MISYIKNLDRIIYSLKIPNNPYNTDDAAENYKPFPSLDNISITEVKNQAWVINYPMVITKDDNKKFINDIKLVGITSVINLNNNITAIGPFVDKKIALIIKDKVNKASGYTGLVKRLND